METKTMTTSPKDALKLAEGARQHLLKCPHGMNCHAPHSQLEAIVCLADSLISAHEKLDELGNELAIVCHFKEKLEKATTALDFYRRIGVPKGATPTGDWEPDFLLRDPYWQDQGKMAREALKEIEG